MDGQNSISIFDQIKSWFVGTAIVAILSELTKKLVRGKLKMEADLVSGPIGNVGSYDLAVKESKLSFKLDAKVAGDAVEAGIVVSVSIVAVIDAIAKAIPGQVDDAIFAVLKAALAK